MTLPVVPRDGDRGAAKADGDVETGEVEPKEGGDRGHGSAGRRDDAVVALVRGRGRRRGSGVGDGGRKGL